GQYFVDPKRTGQNRRRKAGQLETTQLTGVQNLGRRRFVGEDGRTQFAYPNLPMTSINVVDEVVQRLRQRLIRQRRELLAETRTGPAGVQGTADAVGCEPPGARRALRLA